MTDHPQKIYAELTTRCNLRCKMCVKYAEGSCIAEMDLPFSVFRKLAPSLARTNTLILNGIGEPLLHPELAEIIGFARAVMPAEADIGFQSNGILLDRKKCRELIAAGLSTVCLSLDDITDITADQAGEHSATTVSKAMARLLEAQQNTTAADIFRIGLEIVLTRENIDNLPGYITWAADRGADYIIATNLLLYNTSSEKLSLFNPNSSEAVELFEVYSKRAEALGVNLGNCLSTYLKFNKTQKDKIVAQLFEELQQEASKRDIRLHLESLLGYTTADADRVGKAFADGRSIAAKRGIELFLPTHQALPQRTCQFIEEQAVLIAASGAVMPCHFLWHTYSCRVLGEEVQVRECAFGTIRQQPLDIIWQHPEYIRFRREAAEYDYSSCWSCTQGPCANLINDNLLCANDCYGSRVPCGHCQWNLGGVRCL